MATLDGNDFQIPLNETTYPFCWKRIYLGVIIDPENSKAEVNEGNNFMLFPAILDCGGECMEICPPTIVGLRSDERMTNQSMPSSNWPIIRLLQRIHYQPINAKLPFRCPIGQSLPSFFILS